MDKNYIDEVVEELADGYYFHSGFSRDDFDKKIKDLIQQIEKQSYQAGYSKGNKSGFKEGQERKVEEITEEIDEMSFVDKITKERIKRRLLS